MLRIDEYEIESGASNHGRPERRRRNDTGAVDPLSRAKRIFQGNTIHRVYSLSKRWFYVVYTPVVFPEPDRWNSPDCDVGPRSYREYLSGWREKLSSNMTPAPRDARRWSAQSRLRLGSLLALSIAAALGAAAWACAATSWASPSLSHALFCAGAILACGTVALLAARTTGSLAAALLIVAGGAVLGLPQLVDLPAGLLSLVTLLGSAAWVLAVSLLLFDTGRAREQLERDKHRLAADLIEHDYATAPLRESESRFRSVFENLNVSILTTTLEGVITDCNGAVSSELQYSVHQLHGTDIRSLVHEEDRNILENVLIAFSRGESAFEDIQHRLVRRDESLAWYHATLTLVRREQPQTSFVVVVLENTSERRLRDYQVQHRQKMESLGLLAGGIAHDFNNLLVGIMTNSELLNRDLSGEPERTQLCTEIVESAQRAATLCNQLLTYAGKAPKTEQPLNLTELVQHSRELLQAALGHQINLEFRCAAVLPAIMADPSQIRQIVLSLLSNAADAVQHNGGSVTLATGVAAISASDFPALIHETDALPGNYVYVRVADTGSGMPDDAIAKLFDPFYTTKDLGSGLGLAAVAGIVRAHAGMIDIQSGNASGTKITIYFPPTPEVAQPLEAPAKPARESTADTQRGGTVLVVDDEEVVRGAARRILEHHGFSVMTAVDGIDGVEQFEKSHAELTAVLLDLTMPRMNGAAAFEKMHAINPRVPVILSSGYSESEGTDNALADRVAGYLRKPYRIQQLVDLLNKVI